MTPGVEYWTFSLYAGSSRSSQVLGGFFSSFVLWMNPK